MLALAGSSMDAELWQGPRTVVATTGLVRTIAGLWRSGRPTTAGPLLRRKMPDSVAEVG